MKKVELLAPVGSYKGLLSVINAGADAVYLSGKRYTARAYAENFDDDSLIEAIRIAHLFEKKIYLTLNTLVKQSELKGVIPYLRPLYENGLDGVIVQDVGALNLIHKELPGLELHASTQMSLAGSWAVEYLKKFGVTRIVPAREISLEEMIRIKEDTGIEIEAFIHGAMCYCYSGQCLFSSILGGRSGNRGRCAQPCRLPYNFKNNKKELYPMSMKDMCTLPIIGELIEAGIDSFKIEGRMKKPVYAAGVTAIYRKYIDMYYNGMDSVISKEDNELLKSLYLRSEISEGYYHKHNGKDMITLSSPAYNETNDSIISRIEEMYVNKTPKIEVLANAVFCAGEPAILEVKYNDYSVRATGEIVQNALNAPITKERIYEQINKTGDTFFEFSNIKVVADDNIFVPMKSINELRRAALTELKEQIIDGK